MTIRTVWVTGLMLLLSMAAAGCAAAGLAATMLKPPEKVQARYKPTSRPTAVVVENYRLPGSGNSIRDSLASQLVVELRKNNVVPCVDSYKIYDLRSSNPRAYRTMTIDEIGKRVGAEQVIYVDLVNSGVGMSTGGDMVRGDMAALVKVVDVQTGRTLWPDGMEEGYYVSIDIPFALINPDKTHQSVSKSLIQSSADRIAKLFYTWTVPE